MFEGVRFRVGVKANQRDANIFWGSPILTNPILYVDMDMLICFCIRVSSKLNLDMLTKHLIHHRKS